MLDCADQIFIENLLLNMSIGIYDFEKNEKQKVIVDIHLDVTPESQNSPKDIKDVVSYEEVVTKVQKLSQTKHYDLVETFAEEINDVCFSHKAVKQAKIKIGKPDIIEDTKSVGVQIIRKRS